MSPVSSAGESSIWATLAPGSVMCQLLAVVPGSGRPPTLADLHRLKGSLISHSTGRSKDEWVSSRSPPCTHEGNQPREKTAGREEVERAHVLHTTGTRSPPALESVLGYTSHHVTSQMSLVSVPPQVTFPAAGWKHPDEFSSWWAAAAASLRCPPEQPESRELQIIVTC